MSVRLSVRPSVHPFIGPSVCPSVSPSYQSYVMLLRCFCPRGFLGAMYGRVSGRAHQKNHRVYNDDRYLVSAITIEYTNEYTNPIRIAELTVAYATSTLQDCFSKLMLIMVGPYICHASAIQPSRGDLWPCIRSCHEHVISIWSPNFPLKLLCPSVLANRNEM